MKVFEISLLVFLINNINLDKSYSKIGNFIDSAMIKNPKFKKLHEKNTYKNYCFCSFYPLEKSRIYRKKSNYTIKIRTIDKEIANFFNEKLLNHYDNNIKALTSSIRIINKKPIEKIYSITPTIIKTEEGYWKNNTTLEEFERRLKENLIKKYNLINDTNINEKFTLYSTIEFKNRKPIAIVYKNNKILGDKISINITGNKIAQELAYMSLGTGILEMNARGAGYVNAKII